MSPFAKDNNNLNFDGFPQKMKPSLGEDSRRNISTNQPPNFKDILNFAPLLSTFMRDGAGSNEASNQFTFERQESRGIVKTLQKGTVLKGSRLNDNIGEFVIKIDEDSSQIMRVGVNSRQKLEKKPIFDICEIIFEFEHKEKEKSNITGQSLILVKFKNPTKSYTTWEFESQKGLRYKSNFWTSLIKYRLNRKDFQKFAGTGNSNQLVSGFQ